MYYYIFDELSAWIPRERIVTDEAKWYRAVDEAMREYASGNRSPACQYTSTITRATKGNHSSNAPVQRTPQRIGMPTSPVKGPKAPSTPPGVKLVPIYDRSELILEGYLEPRVDEAGKLYVAVVALSVISKQVQHARKVEQLQEETVKAEEAYEQACEQFGADSAQAQATAEAFEQVKAGWLKLKAAQPAS